MRRSGGLPAMIAPLIAPIEVPMIHSGSMPASCSAWNTPTWYAPSAPPPCSTSTTCPGSSNPSPAILTTRTSRSVRGPAAVDRQHRAGNRGRFVGAQERGQRSDLLDRDELARRLCREQHIAHDLLFGNAARLRGVRDLLFDERRTHVSRADRVHRDALLGDFERDCLGESRDAVLRGDIRRL